MDKFKIKPNKLYFIHSYSKMPVQIFVIESYNRIALLAGDISRTISQNLSQTHCTPDNVGNADHKTPCQAVFTTFNLQS